MIINHKGLGQTIIFLAGKASVRTKILGMIIPLVVFLGLWNAVQIQGMAREMAEQQLTKQGISIAGEMASRSADLIFTNDRFALHQLVNDTVKYNEDVRYVFILDGLGNVVANSFGNGLPEGLQFANMVNNEEHHKLLTINTEEGLIYDVAMPIFGGKAGTVRVGMTEKAILSIADTSITKVLLATGIVGLVGIMAAIFLTFVLTTPIKEMVAAAREIEKGNYKERVPLWWGRDELHELGMAFNKMAGSLERGYEARTGLIKKLINAQEEERKRIARELHDETSQSLTSLMIGLKTLEHSQEPAEIKQKVAELRQLTNKTLEEIHDLSLALRPSVLDDLGLVPAINRYLQDCKRNFNMDIDFHAQGMEGVRLPSEVEISIYRVVQEALTNVAKHAKATSVSVILERQGEAVTAIVEDNGVGFDLDSIWKSPVKEKRLGLHGMQERVQLTGGHLTIESSPEIGTTIYAQWRINTDIW